MNCDIRNYEPGDEVAQVEIFNQVIAEMSPYEPLIKVDRVKRRVSHPDFNPTSVKYLVDTTGRIVGYAECRIAPAGSRTSAFLFYPLIVKEYRTEQNLDRLFSEVYAFAQSFNPESIEAHYKHHLEDAHEYFDRQQIAKISHKKENSALSIEVDKLNFDIADFSIKLFAIEDSERLIDFRKSKKSIIGPQLTVETIKRLIKTGYFSPDRTFIAECNGQIRGFWVINYLPTPDYQADFITTITPFGYFRAEIIDSGDPEWKAVRKALLRAAYNFLKLKGIEEFHIFPSDAQGLAFYQKIGFKEDNRKIGQIFYFFE